MDDRVPGKGFRPSLPRAIPPVTRISAGCGPQGFAAAAPFDVSSGPPNVAVSKSPTIAA